MMLNNQRPPVATARFYPQEERDDFTHTLYEEAVNFTVPLEDATYDDGNLFEDFTPEADALHEHENAPRWVQIWEGPFDVILFME